MLAADGALTGGRLNALLINNFRWRDIGEARAGPRLKKPGRTSHIFSGRSVLPEYQVAFRKMNYRESYALNRHP